MKKLSMRMYNAGNLRTARTNATSAFVRSNHGSKHHL
jgi:hypothetical protein